MVPSLDSIALQGIDIIQEMCNICMKTKHQPQLTSHQCHRKPKLKNISTTGSPNYNTSPQEAQFLQAMLHCPVKAAVLSDFCAYMCALSLCISYLRMFVCLSVYIYSRCTCSNSLYHFFIKGKNGNSTKSILNRYINIHWLILINMFLIHSNDTVICS